MTNKWSIVTLSLFFFLATPHQGQKVNILLKEADKLEKSRKETEAFKKYLEVLKVEPNNFSALCRASELCSLIGNRQQEKSSKLDYFRAGRKYAESALRINPGSSEANFVMALAIGRMTLLLSGREKVIAVNDIKKYAENAARADPKSYKAFLILGKWHYEVSNLNTVERMIARVLFGGIPEASLSQAIKFYEKSRSLNPGFALNYLEVAKAYHKNQQDVKAIELLRKLQTLPIKTSDDPRIKSEGNELLKELLR